MFDELVNVQYREGVLVVQCNITKRLVFMFDNSSNVILHKHRDIDKYLIQLGGCFAEDGELLNETTSHTIYFLEAGRIYSVKTE